MTFKEFEATVKHFRDDVIVSKHGDYCNNDSKTTLGVIFIKNGKESKVYDYSGTYVEVLNKLGITEFYTDDMIAWIKNEIERLTKQNGKMNLLLKTKYDNTEKIKELELEKAKLLTYYRASKQ